MALETFIASASETAMPGLRSELARRHRPRPCLRHALHGPVLTLLAASVISGLLGSTSMAASLCLPLDPQIVEVTGIVRVTSFRFGFDRGVNYSLELADEIRSCRRGSQPSVRARSVVLMMGSYNGRQNGPDLSLTDGQKVTLRGSLVAVQSEPYIGKDNVEVKDPDSLQMSVEGLAAKKKVSSTLGHSS